MKTTITAIAVFISVFSVLAEYRALDLFEMIIGAEKIVYGEIIELNSETFTLEVEENLTGTESKLVIQRFKNWTCAYRWTDYQVGQKLFLFLIQNKEGKLYRMSAGNEGELPIWKEHVYISTLSMEVPPPPRPGTTNDISGYLALERHRIYGSEFHSHKTSLRTFVSTVNRIRNCFEIEYGRYNGIEKAVIKCDESVLLEEIKDDGILNWTYRVLKKKTQAPTKPKAN